MQFYIQKDKNSLESNFIYSERKQILSKEY